MTVQPPFRWEKLGHVFAPDGSMVWAKHYAQVPTPILLNDRIRILFTSRPDPEAAGDFVSYTTYLDVARSDPTRVMYVHDAPVMPLGDLGSFDQFGVMPCATLVRDEELWLYYVGWARARGVPWQSAIGVAVSRDLGQSFERLKKGPVLGRTLDEPYVQGSPCIVRSGSLLHMWYLSGTSWIESHGRVESIYKLMHASSSDGLIWQRDGLECVPSGCDDECQARPAVWIDGNRAHMWFSYRRGVDFRNPERGYGIGYAWSDDLISWHRDDGLAGIEKSKSGWDSEMISYPSLLAVDDRQYMFYCGNQMGRAGFGVALNAGYQ